MFKISLNYSINTSFLSEALYEGLLFITLNTQITKISPSHIEIGDLRDAIKSLNDMRLSNMRVQFVENDYSERKRNKPINKLLEMLGLGNITIRRNYGSLLLTLKSNLNRLNFKETININIKPGQQLLIDLKRKDEGIALPQIFKIDRYTGFSSLETKLMLKQVTAYVSKEVALILILGLHSSFIARVVQQVGRGRRNEIYYFLMFSPEEIIKLLSLGSKSPVLIRNLFLIKDLAKDVLEKIVSKTSLNEALAVELSLNLRIREALRNYNLEKVSFILFKVALEGRTYKIYEQTPITIYRIPPFIRILGKFSRDPESIARRIAWVLRPGGEVLRALGDPDSDEHGDVVEAVIGLYRFVVLGDPAGWYLFTRKLMDAHNVALRRKTYNNEYVKLLSNLTF